MNLRSSNVPPHPYHFQPALAASCDRCNPDPSPRAPNPPNPPHLRTRTHNRTAHPEPITATTHQPLAVRARDQTCTCKPLALTPTPTLTLMLTLTPNLNSPSPRSFTNDLTLAFHTLNISLLQTIATTRAIWSHLRCSAGHCHEVVLVRGRKCRGRGCNLCVSGGGMGSAGVPASGRASLCASEFE